MNALLASIFSPLKEPAGSPNRAQTGGRLQDHGSPAARKRRQDRGGVAKRTPVKRKAVAFDMTPQKDVIHTPPKNRLPATPLPSQRHDPDGHDDVEDDDNDVKTTTKQEESDTEVKGEQGTDADANSDSEFVFKRLVGHRWDDDTLQVQVEWESGENTWEPESRLHEDAPDALLAYWERQNGRPENPGRPGFYEIHAVRKHSRDRKRLFVEWVGYGAKDGTWEPRRIVEDAAPGKASEYWDSLPRPKRRRRPRL